MNDHRLKPVASGYGLKPDHVSPSGRRALYDLEVVVWGFRFLILYVFLPHLVRDIPAGHDPIAPAPQMLAPIALPQARELAQKFV